MLRRSFFAGPCAAPPSASSFQAVSIVIALLAAAAAAGATWFALAGLIPAAPLRRANYRGILVPSGMGIAPVAGLASGAAVAALGALITGASPDAALMPLAAAGGFAALGLYDDLTSAGAPGRERGFQRHISALVHGRLTTGGLKLIGGSALAFALAAPVTDGFAFALAGGAVIALSANIVNAFDLRPGRAGKAFLAGAVPLAVVAGPLRAIVCSAIGAMVAFMPGDLRERAMLGDAGSNAFGALLGASAVLLSDKPTLLLVLAVLVVLQLIAEGPTLSRVIGAVPPLRALDRLGRIEEE